MPLILPGPRGRDGAAGAAGIDGGFGLHPQPYGAEPWGSGNTNRIYPLGVLGSAFNTSIAPQQGLGNDRIVAFPFVMRRSSRIDNIGVKVTTATPVGSRVRAGIYSAKAVAGGFYPDARLAHATADANCEAVGYAGSVVNGGSGYVLSPGVLYWAVYAVNNTASSGFFAAYDRPQFIGALLFGVVENGNQGPVGVYGSFAFGGLLPAIFPVAAGLISNAAAVPFGKFGT